jgi:hypothetical protein
LLDLLVTAKAHPLSDKTVDNRQILVHQLHQTQESANSRRAIGLEKHSSDFPRIGTGGNIFRHKSVTPISLSRQKVPKIVGARGFEPRASWSQKLLDSPKTAISEHFSEFELHEVHRITQTGHNLGTLNGGPIANPLLARGYETAPWSNG